MYDILINDRIDEVEDGGYVIMFSVSGIIIMSMLEPSRSSRSNYIFSRQPQEQRITQLAENFTISYPLRSLVMKISVVVISAVLVVGK